MLKCAALYVQRRECAMAVPEEVDEEEEEEREAGAHSRWGKVSKQVMNACAFLRVSRQRGSRVEDTSVSHVQVVALDQREDLWSCTRRDVKDFKLTTLHRSRVIHSATLSVVVDLQHLG